MFLCVHEGPERPGAPLPSTQVEMYLEQRRPGAKTTLSKDDLEQRRPPYNSDNFLSNFSNLFYLQTEVGRIRFSLGKYATSVS